MKVVSAAGRRVPPTQRGVLSARVVVVPTARAAALVERWLWPMRRPADLVRIGITHDLNQGGADG